MTDKIPPKLELRIRKKKAAPDCCPVCNQKAAEPRGPFDYFSIYRSPSYVTRRPVEGWPGFYEWWFICNHRDPIEAQLKAENGLGSLLKEKYRDFGGKTVAIPFRSGK